MQQQKSTVPSQFNPFASIVGLHLIALCGLLLFIAGCSHLMIQAEITAKPSPAATTTRTTATLTTVTSAKIQAPIPIAAVTHSSAHWQQYSIAAAITK